MLKNILILMAFIIGGFLFGYYLIENEENITIKSEKIKTEINSTNAEKETLDIENTLSSFIPPEVPITIESIPQSQKEWEKLFKGKGLNICEKKKSIHSSTDLIFSEKYCREDISYFPKENEFGSENCIKLQEAGFSYTNYIAHDHVKYNNHDYVFLRLFDSWCGNHGFVYTVILKIEPNSQAGVIGQFDGIVKSIVKNNGNYFLYIVDWVGGYADYGSQVADFEVYSEYRLDEKKLTLISRSSKNLGLERAREENKKQREIEIDRERKIQKAQEELSTVFINTYRSRNVVESSSAYREVQRTYGEEIATLAIRRMPIYDSKIDSFISFDLHMRNEVSRNRNRSSKEFTAIERDPVGAGMNIFFDSSAGD